MNPERWQQLDQLFHSALERERDQRAAFLDEACAGDESLRRQVEELLVAHEQAGSFIDRPAMEVEACGLVADQATTKAELVIGDLISHYRIIAPLGSGGMGEVYLAEDISLARKIALKLLPADFTRDGDRVRRFQQEARTASALNHPNIVTIHEIGQVNNRHFIATEFIDGETLRQRISGAQPRATGDRGGSSGTPPKLRDVLNIAIQTADALAAAHEAGIVHRDIKPENIMVRRRDGYVKVLDFGLAKLTEGPIPLDPEGPTRTQIKTSTGVVMGTANYMSPEQARGQAVDRRTDIFSLGVVLYEMVAGCAPFAGETPTDVVASILSREPPPLARYFRDVPETLEWIISKALTKEKEERYQTAKEMEVDLDRLKQRLQFAAELERTTSTERKADAQTKTSIAVLPFANMSPDPENEYFCEGLAEELLNALAKIEDLKVAARTSAFSFKDKNVKVSQIGRALNVNTVLEGSVRKAGNRLRITVQLVNASNGYHLWSERYDCEMKDIFDIQDEITLAVVDALKVKLLGKEKAAVLKRYTDNAEAYQLYLRGRFFWNERTPKGFEKCIGYFEQAIELDADYALAYSGLADCYSFLGFYEVLPPQEAGHKSKAAALKAVALDHTIAETHASLGAYKSLYEWDWSGCEREYKEAIKLNPNYATAHQWYATLLGVTGRSDESVREAKVSQELDPLSPIVNGNAAWWSYVARRYDDAIDQSVKIVDIAPNHFFAHWVLGMTYAQKAVYAEAIAELQKATVLSGGSLYIKADLALVQAKTGQTREAQQMLMELIEQSKEQYVSSVNIAKIYAGLGEKEQAFEWLERAIEERSVRLPWFIIDPMFDSLRSDARFGGLMRRVILTP